MAHPRLLLLIAALLISPLGTVNHANAASKVPVVKPKVFNPTDDINIKLIDPRTKKTINPIITKFWVNLNRLNYATYSDKTLDTFFAKGNVTEIWGEALTNGYPIEAAPTNTNVAKKGIWVVTSSPGDNFISVSPKGTGCQNLGSTLRFRGALFTCIENGNLHEYDQGVIYGNDHRDGVLGDGYISGIDAPTRDCLIENQISFFYGATIKCYFLSGIRVPQISNAVTMWNSKNPPEIYCILDRTLAKQSQPMVGFMEYVLINSSCAKYFGNKTAKF